MGGAVVGDGKEVELSYTAERERERERERESARALHARTHCSIVVSPPCALQGFICFSAGVQTMAPTSKRHSQSVVIEWAPLHAATCRCMRGCSIDHLLGNAFTCALTVPSSNFLSLCFLFSPNVYVSSNSAVSRFPRSVSSFLFF